MLLEILPGYSYAELVNESIGFKGKILFFKDKEIFILNGSVNNKIKIAEGLYPSWSPDTKRVAYSKENDLFVVDIDGKNARKIANGIRPRWSPDSKRIAYIKGDDLFVIDSDGKNERSITRSGGFQNLLDVFWYESHEIFITNPKTHETMVVNPETGKIEKRETELIDYLKTSKKIISVKTILSPDRKYKLAKLQYKDSTSTVLIEIASNKVTELKSPPPYLGWSKDCKKIGGYYASASDETFPVTFTDELVIYDVKSGKVVKRLKDLRNYFGEERQVWCHGTTWSPDSKYIAYECGFYSGEPGGWIYIVNLETGKPIKLIQGSNPDWH